MTISKTEIALLDTNVLVYAADEKIYKSMI